MSIYGENWQRFRDAPSAVALLLTSASTALIAAPLTSALLSGLDVFLASLTGLFGPLFLYGPVAAPFRIPRLMAAPLDLLYDYSTGIIAVSALLLAVLLVWFWPTEQRLATRLFVHGFALNLILWGCLAPSFSLDAFRLAERRTVPAIVWSGVLLLAGAWASMLVQRKSVELLMNLFASETPGQRLARWALTIPFPFALLGLASLINLYDRGAWACGVVIGATFLETISRQPRPRHEQIKSPMLREASFTLPIVAAVVLAASVWAFGFVGAGRGPRVAVWRDSRVSLPSIRDFQASLRFETRIEEVLGDKANPELEIRWSKDRAKGKGVTVPRK